MTQSPFEIVRTSPRSISLLQIHGALQAEVRMLSAQFAAEPGESAGPVRPMACPVGPTEWLLIDWTMEEVRRRLNAINSRMLVRITDVSAAFVSMRIEGSAARTILLSDVSAPGFLEGNHYGHCVRTSVGQIEVVLHCLAADAFEAHVDRSVADHFMTWLEAQYRARFPTAAMSNLVT